MRLSPKLHLKIKSLFPSVLSAREKRGSLSDTGVSVFPSASALASPHWPQFEDRAALTMDLDAAPHSAIFVAFKNLDLVSSLEERGDVLR